MSYLADCQKRRVIFFTGKGGVGKTTLAWATALACHRQGKRVTVVNLNAVEGSNNPISAIAPTIEALSIEPMAAFQEYALRFFKFEALYNAVFENPVFRTFVRAAPGLSDTVTAGKIFDLYKNGSQDLLIVDLPASGHAISFFESPMGMKKIFKFGFVHKETEHIERLFLSEETRLDLVSLPSELPLTETVQLKAKLSDIGRFSFGFLHMNACVPVFEPEEKVPGAAAKYYARYEKERVEEKEVEPLEEEVNMPRIRIPRSAEASTIKVIESVAVRLENA